MKLNTEGHLHPINRVIEDILQVFVKMGFEIALGNELEDSHHNFDALNVPKDHPSRDMQDTFWIKNSPDQLLRTHTSPVQIRYMETHKPPIKIVAPGKVFRNESTDRTHEVAFHQIEGLVVGEKISLGHLKFALNSFIREIFGKDIKTVLRPGYFPFVEPGLEIDMECFRCGGQGCNTCKRSGWIEILGAGMVHPKVLNGVGINPKKYNGFAFGLGIDRIVMMRYGIEDIRLLYSGDIGLVGQI